MTLFVSLLLAACVEKEVEYVTVEKEGGSGSPNNQTPEGSSPQGNSQNNGLQSYSGGILKFRLIGADGSPSSTARTIEVLKGSEVTLEWETEKPFTASLLKDNETLASPLPAQGSHTVTVDKDAIYSLVIPGKEGIQAATLALKVTNTLCLGQPNCSTNIGKQKGIGYTYYQPFACQKPDGTVCVMLADAGDHRVLRWCGDNIQKGEPDLVLGQTDFYSSAANRGGTAHLGTLSEPRGVWCDGRRVVVADTKNHRVLIWNRFETLQNGDAADVVIGQPNPQWNLPNQGGGPTNKSLRSPTGVWVDPPTGSLFVTDSENHRILIKRNWPTTDGQGFDVVIGQANFISAAQNRGGGDTGPAANSLFAAHGVSTFNGKLIISDSWNNRVLIFNQIPQENDASADFVIGQPGPTTNNTNNAGRWLHPFNTIDKERGIPNATTLVYPVSAYATEEGLWVSDHLNHRLLRFPIDFTANLQSPEVPRCVDDNNVPLNNDTGTPLCPVADRVLGFENFTQKNQDLFPEGTLYRLNKTLTLSAATAPPVGCRLFVAVANSSVREFNLCEEGNNLTAVGLIGQPRYDSRGTNHALPSASLINSAHGIWADRKGVWITDPENHRVIGYKGIPLFSGAKASFVLGQADFEKDLSQQGEASPNRETMVFPQSVAADNSRIYVAGGNNRVLIWGRDPTTGAPSGPPQILGQSSPTDAADPPLTNPTCGRFSPSSVVSDGRQLWVMDTGKYQGDPTKRRYRVLGFSLESFNTLPPEGGLLTATRLFGERDCTTTGSGRFYIPRHAFSDGTRLLISDTPNHRVFYYETIPEDPMALPTATIGVANPDGRPTAFSLNLPDSAVFWKNLIFVADSGNHRILVFQKPAADRPSAIAVLGQDNMTLNFTNGNRPLSGDGFAWPRRLWIEGNLLFIADNGNQRVVVKNIEELLSRYGTE